MLPQPKFGLDIMSTCIVVSREHFIGKALFYSLSMNDKPEISDALVQAKESQPNPFVSRQPSQISQTISKMPLMRR